MGDIIPVFVGGCDRSGTTMLGDMLGAGKGLFSTPESHFFHELAYGYYIGRFKSRVDVADWLLNDYRFTTWRLNVSHDRLCSVLSLDSARRSIEGVLRLYMEENGIDDQATIWVDHTPDNVKYSSILGLTFPEAKFIHIVRDGRGVANSIVPLRWGPNNYFMASRYWYERVRQGIMMETQYGGNCIRVRYEDILSRDEYILKQICHDIGIEFDNKMLTGGGVILPDFTKKQHKLVGSRVDPSRAYSWKKSMSLRDQMDFYSYNKSVYLLRSLDYEVTISPVCSSYRMAWLYLSDCIVDIVNKGIGYRNNKKEITRYNNA